MRPQNHLLDTARGFGIGSRLNVTSSVEPVMAAVTIFVVVIAVLYAYSHTKKGKALADKVVSWFEDLSA